MTPTDPFLSSLTAAAACSFLLKLAQVWKKIPWVTEHTATLNLVIRGGLSLLATVGIGHAWSASQGGGGTFTMTIPPLMAIVTGIWHWFGQFAIQHSFGKVLDIGTLKQIDTPVQVNQVDAPKV